MPRNAIIILEFYYKIIKDQASTSATKDSHQIRYHDIILLVIKDSNTDQTEFPKKCSTTLDLN